MIYGKYSVVLKTLMDNPEVKKEIDKALSTYPMYVPENPSTYSIIPTREQLNNKLLNHYKYREIGFETVGRFLDELEITMNEIMPYYYQLFKSADIMNGIDDPFGNVDIVEVFEQTTEGETTGESDSNSSTTASSSTNTDMTTTSKNVNSKTPQSQLDVAAADIDSLKYADNVDWNKSESGSTGTTTDEGTSTSGSTSRGQSTGRTEEIRTKKGNQGVNTYAHDMNELRETFLNIEMQIIEDKRIQELFMLIY